MEQPDDRHYEIRGYAFSYISNTVVGKYGEAALRDVLEKLKARFGPLSEEESEEVQNLLSSFGREIEKLAGERRYESDKRWRAYRQGYYDGKKSV